MENKLQHQEYSIRQEAYAAIQHKAQEVILLINEIENSSSLQEVTDNLKVSFYFL